MLTLTENKVAHENKMRGLRPLSWWQTILAFGIPTLMMVFSFHGFMPWLQSIGLTPFASIVVSHTVPMALLLTASLVMYHQIDGYPLTRQAFCQRCRYPRLTLKAMLQGIGLFGVLLVGYGMFDAFAALLIGRGWLPLPSSLPALLDPRIPLTSTTLDIMVGGRISGNWDVVVLYTIMLVFNIVGEELWWRGYLLPRQEAVHGRFTWIWHGLLWTAFHVFKWWDLIGLLPVCLAIAYISQRTKNNWIAFIAHFLFNGLGLLGMVMAVIA